MKPETREHKERVWIELGCSERYRPLTQEEIDAYFGVVQSKDPSVYYLPLISMGNKPPHAIIDAEDRDRVCAHGWRGHRVSKHSMRVFGKIDGRYTAMARFILGITDRKIHVHHRNENPLDNRKSNLLPCTVKEHWEQHRILRAQKEKGVHLS